MAWADEATRPSTAAALTPNAMDLMARLSERDADAGEKAALFHRQARGRRAVGDVSGELVVLVRKDIAAAHRGEAGDVGHYGGVRQQHEGGGALRQDAVATV